jgi:hypothetical protein
MYALNQIALSAAKAKGFFFLRHVLNDFSTPRRVEAILSKALALYENDPVSTGRSYTPLFTFSELAANGTGVQRFRMNIHSFIREGQPGSLAATLDLVLVEDTEEHAQVLEIDHAAYGEIPDQALSAIAFSELQSRVRDLADLFEPPYSEFLRCHLLHLNALVCGRVSQFTFDLTSSSRGVEICTRRQGDPVTIFHIKL